MYFSGQQEVDINHIIFWLWWSGLIYSTVCKQKLFELEKQYSQEKTSHAQMEQRLLAQMASHEETRIQLQSTCNAYEKTQQESEGKVDIWKTRWNERVCHDKHWCAQITIVVL